jgi:hypothetical protein
MAKQRTEVVAASLLRTWTDSDTAMQVVGSSLGVFGAGPLDPTVVLADETPLRNALFDVLLSLVEGGALDMRLTGDGRYAFRWREDIAVAGLSRQGSTAIDLSPPSPHVEELARARAERDDARDRADIAEALAAERERLLRLAGVVSPGEPPGERRRLPPEARDELLTLDSRDESILDALYRTHPTSDRRVAAASTASIPESSGAKPSTRKSAPRKSARAKAPVAEDIEDIEDIETVQTESNDVLYLSQRAQSGADLDITEESSAAIDDAEGTETRAPRTKWSGYAIDTNRSDLSGVEGLADGA